MNYIRSHALALAAMLCLFALQTLVQPVVSAQAQSTRARLKVIVTTAAGQPLAGARVNVPALKFAGSTDTTGQLNAQLDLAGPTKIELAVNASGYRPWRIRNATLLPRQTLIIEAPLSAQPSGPQLAAPELIDVQPHRLESGAPQTVEPQVSDGVSISAAGTNTTPPTTIRVYRVSLGRIDTVDFRSYVKHVLPNEWIASWPAESLRSGAMASKTYGWYRTMYAKYPGQGYDAKDTTADQVYNPNVSYASTNAAVDDTWGYRLVRNNAIFQAQYCAGSYNGSRTSGQCSEKHGWTVGQYMSQWGSKYLTDQGWSWRSILTFYYDNVTIAPISGDGTPQLPPWPQLRQGAQGPRVTAAQYLLRQRSYSLAIDGSFGPETEAAVRAFQQDYGLSVDGIIGPNTFQKLIGTVRRGDINDAVRAIQTLLNVSVDGEFGPITEAAAKDIQASYGLVQDGIVGPLTWQAAFGK